ncbi:hypothetical protein MTR67_001384 [Solanum verrucosum]|uniref:Uncharacterized protein n=1 Tax=Solanum verrucosum TaxID=315347 RepID=A0AAF0PU62_SOLVR|nr:hypothetical protein MTR67_001384 [Solanum verrucosum]
MAQFSYNLQRSESTGCTPFELATGQQPQTPHSLSAAFEEKSLVAYHLAKGWGEQFDTAKSYLDKAASNMKKFVDRKRHPTDYKEGDMVLARSHTRWSYLHTSKSIWCFMQASSSPYHEDKEDTSQNQSRRAPITVTTSHDLEIEAIIDYQAKRKRGKKASAILIVHWKGQSPEEATCQLVSTLVIAFVLPSSSPTTLRFQANTLPFLGDEHAQKVPYASLCLACPSCLANTQAP